MSASSSLRTSPTGRCLTGANGPTSLRGMVDALQQESLSIQRTAFNILSTSTSASVSNNNASNVTIQQDDVAYASLAIVRRFASLASVKRLVTDFSSVFSKNAQPGVSRTTVHSAAAGAALMEAATDALAIIVDSINTPTTTPTVGAGAGSKGGSTTSRPSITPPTTTTTAGRMLLSITSLSDGSAASVATLEIIASLIRVVLLNLLLASSSSDSSNPGSSNTGIGGSRGGSTQQRGGGRGGSGNRREMPAHVDPSASTSGPSSFLHNAASLGAFVATLVKVVVTFSTVGQLAVTTPRNLSAAASINQSAKIAEQEVRVLSLFLITGLAMQHAEAIIDAQSSLIATLFPPVTSLDSLFSTKGGTVGGSGAVSLRFPLLSPLLHDRVHRVRNAASIAICQLLNRLQPRLGLCAEPGPRDSKSFTSLSTGLGVIVRDLHSVLLRALTVTSKFSAAAASSSNSNNTSHHFAAAALPAFVTLSSSSHHVISCAGLINIASSMILVTPYSRCPDSQSSMLKVLQLPLLEEILSLSLLPSSSPSSSHSGGDVVAMCSLLSGAWRAKAFQQPLLAATGCHENIATATTEGGKTSAAAAKTSVSAKKGDAPATAASGTSVSPLQSIMTKYVDLLTELATTITVIPLSVVDKPAATATTFAASNGGRSITTSPPALSGGGEYGGSSSSRSSLSIDAMRALTHAARSFPQYISPSATTRILHLCTQLTEQYIAAASDSSVAAANTSITAVSEMLRLLMHLCGLAWEAFGPSTSSSSKGDEVDDGTPAVGGSGDLLGNTAVAKPQTAAATLKQRAEVILSVYCPLLSSSTVSSSVRCLVYKCLGQIGDDAVFLCCSSLTSSSSGGGTSGKRGGGGAAGPTPSSSYRWRSVLLLPVTTTVGGASSIIDVQQTSCESLQFIAAVLHRAMSETDSSCRAEAMQTAGIWALKYPKSLGGAITTPSSSEGTVSSSGQPVTSSHVAALSLFTRLGRGRLVQDPDDDVRSKALFLLSNICAVCMELTEHRNNTAQRQPQAQVVEALDELLQQLCVITLDAVNTSYRLRSTRGLQAQSPASAIAGQAVRMIQYLLKSLDPDRLIDELPGHPEGVISCFSDLLQRFLRCPASVGLSVSGEEETVAMESGAAGGASSGSSGGLMGRSENNNAAATAPRNSNNSSSAAAPSSSSSSAGAGQLWDIKTRWNAAFALGEVLSVPHIYAADPPAARICVQTLILSIGHDSNFKVRTRAAIAFTKLIQHVVELSKRRWVIQVESSSTSSPSSAAATSSSSRRPAATLFSMEEDAYRGDVQALIPDALDALCGALLFPATTTAGAPGGTSAQTPPPPFREVKPFTDAVRATIVVLLDAAPSTETFQLVLSKHKKMLLDERLLM